MNFKSIAVLFALATMTFFTSCDKDPAEPVIGEYELGMNDSRMATIGEEFHMDIAVEAEGKIEKITIDMHNEDGTGDDIEAEFTEFAGMKNVDFHEHIKIPATTTPGEYHFHFTVTDQEGNSVDLEADIDVVE